MDKMIYKEMRKKNRYNRFNFNRNFDEIKNVLGGFAILSTTVYSGLLNLNVITWRTNLEDVYISDEEVYHIVSEKLFMRKLFTKWMPYLLIIHKKKRKHSNANFSGCVDHLGQKLDLSPHSGNKVAVK